MGIHSFFFPLVNYFPPTHCFRTQWILNIECNKYPVRLFFSTLSEGGKHSFIIGSLLFVCFLICFLSFTPHFIIWFIFPGNCPLMSPKTLNFLFLDQSWTLQWCVGLKIHIEIYIPMRFLGETARCLKVSSLWGGCWKLGSSTVSSNVPGIPNP